MAPEEEESKSNDIDAFCFHSSFNFPILQGQKYVGINNRNTVKSVVERTVLLLFFLISATVHPT